jgi:hypothetical protein
MLLDCSRDISSVNRLPISALYIHVFFIVLLVRLFAPTQALAQSLCPPNLPDEFRIELKRLGTDKVNDQGKTVARIYGDVGVNNHNLGRFYENPSLKISAGTYRGVLRYQGDHNFVQTSCGQMSRKGDFLLEVTGVKGSDGQPRTNILFHPGALPSNSRGCILFGARKFDSNHQPLPLERTDTLVRIRQAFYNTDNPVACPNKRITITISE